MRSLIFVAVSYADRICREKTTNDAVLFGHHILRTETRETK